jgi:ABC-type transport system involved in cytochrome c biogenesis permease subunit
MLRAYAGDQERGARYAAVLGIIGSIDIPIIHQSVKWWRSLHPEPIVLNTSGPNLPNSMLATLLVCFAGFTLLYVYLMIQKVRIETARDLLAEWELDRMLTTHSAQVAATRPREMTGSTGSAGPADERPLTTAD